MSANKFILTLLFLPFLLIIGWIIYWKLKGEEKSEKQQRKKELAKKILVHIRNFSPSRLKKGNKV